MFKKVAVLGLGNILLKDEGLGIHIIEALRKLPLPEYVEVIDGGTASLGLLPSVGGSDKLIIIDTLTRYGEPATIYRILADELVADSTCGALSLHQVGALEAITLAKKTGNLPPQTVIIGVEPKEINWGLDLSKEVAQKVPEVINMVLKELNLLEKTRG